MLTYERNYLAGCWVCVCVCVCVVCVCVPVCSVCVVCERVQCVSCVCVSVCSVCVRVWGAKISCGKVMKNF